jgi:hypothetical protein
MTELFAYTATTLSGLLRELLAHYGAPRDNDGADPAGAIQSDAAMLSNRGRLGIWRRRN